KDSGIEWIGEVPKHWKVSKLKYEFRIKKEIAGSEGYDVLSVTQNGLKIKDLTINEGQMAANYSKYQFVKENDFVMNHMDLLTGWVDYSAFNGVTSPDYRVFYMAKPHANSAEYYKYVFQICYKNKIFYGIAQGVSNLGRWRLQADKFLNSYLPIPPKEEQEQIAKYVKSAEKKFDEIIRKKQMLIIELEQYKKSLIYEYVTGKKEVE
ncbi:MAG TPA: restriction endonuclease subunit S, partial [Clostridiaceae bacterium]|nr:restriction endonuclease subunit S [Clostridiaceae bacterium]